MSLRCCQYQKSSCPVGTPLRALVSSPHKIVAARMARSSTLSASSSGRSPRARRCCPTRLCRARVPPHANARVGPRRAYEHRFASGTQRLIQYNHARRLHTRQSRPPHYRPHAPVRQPMRLELHRCISSDGFVARICKHSRASSIQWGYFQVGYEQSPLHERPLRR